MTSPINSFTDLRKKYSNLIQTPSENRKKKYQLIDFKGYWGTSWGVMERLCHDYDNSYIIEYSCKIHRIVFLKLVNFII